MATLARNTSLLVAAVVTLLVAIAIARRITFPYDLEWAEGSMLCHALRLLDGRPLYAPPSLDFIAHPYTPLQPLIVALLARLFGLGYVLARLVSLGAFIGALAVGWRFLRDEGVPRAVTAVALAIVVGVYSPTGAWYDLGRVDSLFLFFAAAGLTLAWRRRASHAGVALAALVLVAAFFTKQTALPLVLAVAGLLAWASPRRLPTFVLTLLVAGVPLALWLQHASHGWFWFYVVRMKQSQGVDLPTLVAAPGRMAALILPALVLIGWALVVDRPRAPSLWAALYFAAVAVAMSAVARATPHGYVNAYIPGLYFASLAAGIAGARLIARGHETETHALLALAVALAPGVLPWLGGKLGGPAQRLGYDVASLVPADGERARGDALIARLRAVDGEVLIPGHPFYAQLAGKRVFLSQMGIGDLVPSGVPVADLDGAVASGRFAAVVLDEPLDPVLAPIVARYPIVARIDGPCVVGDFACVRQWRTRP